MPNRRDILKGLFSGIILLGASVASGKQLVRVFQKYDNYTAPGKFNIWYIWDEKWHLLSDNQEAPFEFDSKGDAESYIDRLTLERYGNKNRVAEGMVKVRPAPKFIHNFDYMRRTQADAHQLMSEMLDDVEVTTRVAGLVTEMLTKEDGAEQSGLWLSSLKQPDFKKEILILQSCKKFKTMIRGVFFPSTYHTSLAKLEVFSNPKYITYPESSNYLADQV